MSERWGAPRRGGNGGRVLCGLDVGRRSRRRGPGLFLVILALLAGTASAARAQELTCSVAISMKGALEELGRRFQRTHPSVVLRFNFGSSGELQKQIEAGAPIDLFVSAADRQMDELERKGLILAATRRRFAQNVLSVIVPADSRVAIARPADLLQPTVRRVAIGNPKTVPAGQYAEESLRRLGLWDGLRSRLVFGENARQVLEYVARGELEAGFVYATDVAARAGLIREAFRPPQASYTAVTYPAAVVTGSRHGELGRAFIALLLSREGQDALARLGFQPPTEAP